MQRLGHGKKANRVGRLEFSSWVERFVKEKVRAAFQFDLKVIRAGTRDCFIDSLGQNHSVKGRYPGDIDSAAEKQTGAKRARIFVAYFYRLDRKDAHDGGELGAG